MNCYYENEVYKEDVKRSFESIVAKEKLSGKTVLVTGASGLVGSFISDVLIEAGAFVYVAGRNIRFLFDRFPKAVPLEYDLNKEIDFDRDVDYIIHAAGYGHPAAFIEDPIGILTAGINGTLRILEYARKHCSGRFLYVSSGEVYGNIDPMNPRACYPLGKQACENLCASYKGKFGLDTVAVRLCHTFGPGISDKDNRATAQFFRNAINGEDIILKSKGEQRRSYLYVADSASAILSVLTTGVSGKAYDIASPDCIVTIAELAKMIADAAGVKVLFDIPDDMEVKQLSPIKEQILNHESLRLIGWEKEFDVFKGCQRVLLCLKK